MQDNQKNAQNTALLTDLNAEQSATVNGGGCPYRSTQTYRPKKRTYSYRPTY
ncbi:hypothetical protein [Lusitaniella coriacea]|uniref:hypothetical protein n=1 Tax=Lusitaniella coriacea TaxID=1983105 RepID=UPI003CE6F37A